MEPTFRSQIEPIKPIYSVVSPPQEQAQKLTCQTLEENTSLEDTIESAEPKQPTPFIDEQQLIGQLAQKIETKT